MSYVMNAPDQKSLALHQAIAGKLRRQPELFARVQARMPQYVARGEELGSGRYHRRWADLVAQGMDAAVAMALDESEEGQVMRSCTPFTGVLTERERQDFLRAWRASREAAGA